MKLTPPKNITWWIAVVIGILGLIAPLLKIPFLSANKFWFEFVAFAILAVATLVKGL